MNSNGRGARYTFTIALAGNANVGKSVIFNQLTGGSQIVGNWPGKTVEIAEGVIEHNGRRIRIVDLPGIYSLSAYSEEEVVAREFITEQKPDLVIVVVDAANLYRNLFFLLQVLETGANTIVALNQYDIVKEKGIDIDTTKLESLLKVKVVKTIATRNTGLAELFDEALKSLSGQKVKKVFPEYGKEVQHCINMLMEKLEQADLPFEKYFGAVKLLEKDPSIEKLVSKNIIDLRDTLALELEKIHGEPVETVMIKERYSLAATISSAVMTTRKPLRRDLTEKLDNILLGNVTGYIALIVMVLFVFLVVFRFGSFLSELISTTFNRLEPYFMSLQASMWLKKIIWNGIIEGLFAAIAIVLPYIVPFYLFLSFLEDSGYLARIAFLTDALMHRLGVHGKAFIPLIESFGCSVPAIMGTRVLERKRDRIITSILATLIPCSARSVVIFGLIAVFLGPLYAVLIYALDFALIFVVGLLLNRFLKGTPTGLIMEMPRYRKPVLRVIIRQTWIRLREFIVFALPIIVVSNALMEVLILLNAINILTVVMKPFAWILGIPALACLTLIFGVLRKELTLIMLATFYSTSNFSSILTPRQMIVFGFFTMVYIPCAASIAALRREFGNLTALSIAVFEVLLALLLGGLLNVILSRFMV